MALIRLLGDLGVCLCHCVQAKEQWVVEFVCSFCNFVCLQALCDISTRKSIQINPKQSSLFRFWSGALYIAYVFPLPYNLPPSTSQAFQHWMRCPWSTLLKCLVLAVSSGRLMCSTVCSVSGEIPLPLPLCLVSGVSKILLLPRPTKGKAR